VCSGATVSLETLLASYETTGFQGTAVGLAVRRINEMVRQHAPLAGWLAGWLTADGWLSWARSCDGGSATSPRPRATTWWATRGARCGAACSWATPRTSSRRACATSSASWCSTSSYDAAELALSAASTNTRAATAAQVDVVVTTAGGIEEDIIKCLAPTYIGDFALPGRELRLKGINRTGNLLVPNDNYCKFEDFLMPVLDAVRCRKHSP